MPQQALTNIGINYAWDSAEDGWKAGNDNNLALLDNLAQPYTTVTPLTVAAQPASPADGAAYIIGPSAPTGTNWSGRAVGDFAVFNTATLTNGGWSFATPREGWRVFDRVTGYWWEYIGGAWVADSGVHTSDVSGFVTDPSIAFHFSKAKNSVTLRFPEIGGTSDAATMALVTALPVHLRPARAQTCMIRTKDNGAGAFSLGVAVVQTSGVIDFYQDLDVGTWTASLAKAVGAGVLAYNLT